MKTFNYVFLNPKYKRIFCYFLSAYLGFTASPSFAQIIPDQTLGIESSQVREDTINGLPSDRIEGGANRGVNLFHSFQDFNIPEGRGAYFANPDGIANIITRVTGGNPSNLLGTLGVLGTANLFFLNPKGIIFGPNSRLDLQGAFIGSTADSVIFNDGFGFSATNPQAPLLTINIPIGLQFRQNPGNIINQSQISRLVMEEETPVGLEVPPGQTLALIGGNINLQNGNLTAFNGNILLGSVTSPDFVKFNLTPIGLSLDYSNVSNFGDITLSGTASVNTSGLGGGSINLKGNTITLRNRANLISDTLGDFNGRDITLETSQFKLYDNAFIETVTVGTGNAGNIVIRATDSAELRGVGFETFRRNAIEQPLAGEFNPFVRDSGLLSASVGAGLSGNITLETQSLTIQEGMFISSVAYNVGAGGNILIKAPEFVEVAASGIYATTLAQGNAGTLRIDTGKLTIGNGAVVATVTLAEGRGGDIVLNASDSVIITEERPDSPVSTGIATNTFLGTGDAGNIEINAGSLIVEDGGAISSASGFNAVEQIFVAEGRGGNITINAIDSVIVTGTASRIVDRLSRSQVATGSFGTAVSGDLTINTQRLIVDGGGAIIGSTLAAGAGGNVNINASELVEISGTTPDGSFPSSVATASGDRLLQSKFPTLNPTGAAGNLNLTTQKLEIGNGGIISVESIGTGQAGTINVIADRITLDNKGSIDGTTVSGAGANLNLQAQDIRLRRGSRIRTDAGSSEGGNITLNSGVLIVFPGENSDITANAQSARGGTVTVNVPNIFGATGITREEIQDQLGLTDQEFAALEVNPTTLIESSDIAAISQAGGASLQGTVTFSTSGINPVQGLVELPETVVDPGALIAANPCIQGEGSEFTLTGRGGVPPSPKDVLNSEASQWQWVEPTPEGSTAEMPLHSTSISASPVNVVPAQGWVMNAQGEVTLVATNPTTQLSQRSWRPLGGCPPQSRAK